MARLSHLTALMVLAVLCAGPAVAATCAIACAADSSSAATQAARADESCHQAAAPTGEPVMSLADHDCHDHGGESEAATAVAPGRTDTAALIAHASTGAVDATPLAPAGSPRVPAEAPFHSHPQTPVIPLRI